jgi:hypothetical protein
MKRQGNMTPRKVNTTRHLMDGEGDETSIIKFQRMMIKMIAEFKKT